MVHLECKGCALALSMDKARGKGKTAPWTLGLGCDNELTGHKVMPR